MHVRGLVSNDPRNEGRNMKEGEVLKLEITFTYPPLDINTTSFYFDVTQTAREALDDFLRCHPWIPRGEYRLALEGNKIIDPNSTFDSIGIDNGAWITVIPETEAREKCVPCSERKTVERYLIDGDLHRHPADQACVLWRYMDFAKFESLITRAALFFSRMDRFDDSKEGDLPAGNRWVIFSEIAQVMGDRTASYHADVISRNLHLETTRTVVNCWSMGDNESSRLWREYVKDSEGVAIRGSFEMLTRSIVTKDVRFGVVRYINLSQGYNADIQATGRYGVCTTKDHSFAFERELRAILFDQTCDRGVFTAVNLASLFDTVILKPGASRRFSDRVSALLASKGLTQDIRESQL